MAYHGSTMRNAVGSVERPLSDLLKISPSTPMAVADWRLMSDETNPSARYRRLAREALGAANAMAPGENRDALLQMAQVWERLADQRADSTAALLRSAEGEEQPAMQQQQQQQVQPDDDATKN